ncbi:MAG TPA: hypothetical protein DHW45_14935, partial [Candidatus Latescibacteria bacterium]|nr:hypothetical protein [Candidatus Latescibacterota bacterium]
RVNRETNWCGGDARSMREEFTVYGLPSWAMPTVGTMKVGCALSLLLGIVAPSFTAPAALGLATLMLGAVVMHTKIKDPIVKSLPAFSLLLLCAFVMYASTSGIVTAEPVIGEE